MWCPHAILRIIFAYILYKNVGRPLLNIRNLSPGDSRCFIRICLLFSSASMKHGSTKLISPRCHSCEGFYFIKGIILESSNSAPSLFQSLLHGLLSSTSSVSKSSEKVCLLSETNQIIGTTGKICQIRVTHHTSTNFFCNASLMIISDKAFGNCNAKTRSKPLGNLMWVLENQEASLSKTWRYNNKQE